MRALSVLFALLLLALKTPAEPLRERAAELPSQEQPEIQDKDMAISFEGDECVTRDNAGFRHVYTCYCTFGLCLFFVKQFGFCPSYVIARRLCCH